jgi:hypothetical protein
MAQHAMQGGLRARNWVNWDVALKGSTGRHLRFCIVTSTRIDPAFQSLHTLLMPQ